VGYKSHEYALNDDILAQEGIELNRYRGDALTIIQQDGQLYLYVAANL
jgi:hypothetical protein